jgi:hypothetical protein
MQIRKIALSAIGLLAAVGIGASTAATAASASSSVVIASTQVSNHPDTTSGGSGTACTSSPGGPVWAKDAYTSQLTAVSTGTGTWRVTLQDTGSFAGFADPNTCDALVSKGNLLGLYTVTVNSTGTPSQANLKSSYSGAVSSTAMVQDFFGDPSATVTGGDYFFSYQDGAYVQTTSSIYGDVSAYTAPPPVLVKIPVVKGLRANVAIAKVQAAGFKTVTSPIRNPKYTYVATGTSPTGSAPKGSLVTILVKRV